MSSVPTNLRTNRNEYFQKFSWFSFLQTFGKLSSFLLGRGDLSLKISMLCTYSHCKNTVKSGKEFYRSKMNLFCRRGTKEAKSVLPNLVSVLNLIAIPAQGRQEKDDAP